MLDPTFGGLLLGGQPPVMIPSNLKAGDKMVTPGMNITVVGEEGSYGGEEEDTACDVHVRSGRRRNLRTL